MDMPKKVTRLIIGLFLVALLFSLCLYYYTNVEAHSEYPSLKMIMLDPESYDGTVVSEGGEVTKANTSSFVITSMDKDLRFNFVINSNEEVHVGDSVEVLGIFHSPNMILPDKMIITRAFSQKMVYVRSLLGLLILAIVFFRSWKFDLKRFVFMSRRN